MYENDFVVSALSPMHLAALSFAIKVFLFICEWPIFSGFSGHSRLFLESLFCFLDFYWFWVGQWELSFTFKIAFFKVTKKVGYLAYKRIYVFKLTLSSLSFAFSLLSLLFTKLQFNTKLLEHLISNGLQAH